MICIVSPPNTVHCDEGESWQAVGSCSACVAANLSGHNYGSGYAPSGRSGLVWAASLAKGKGGQVGMASCYLIREKTHNLLEIFFGRFLPFPGLS